MEWKALANAIIHDGFDPNLKFIHIVCEKCQYPFLYVAMENKHEAEKFSGSRVTYYITVCPACGNKELNIIGTHSLPRILPENILPFIGYFMIFQGTAQEMLISQRNILEGKEDSVLKDPVDPKEEEHRPE